MCLQTAYSFPSSCTEVLRVWSLLQPEGSKKPLVKQSEVNFGFWPTLLIYNEMKFLPSYVFIVAELKQKAMPRESEHWKRKTL